MGVSILFSEEEYVVFMSPRPSSSQFTQPSSPSCGIFHVTRGREEVEESPPSIPFYHSHLMLLFSCLDLSSCNPTTFLLRPIRYVLQTLAKANCCHLHLKLPLYLSTIPAIESSNCDRMSNKMGDAIEGMNSKDLNGCNIIVNEAWAHGNDGGFRGEGSGGGCREGGGGYSGGGDGYGGGGSGYGGGWDRLITNCPSIPTLSLNLITRW